MKATWTLSTWTSVTGYFQAFRKVFQAILAIVSFYSVNTCLFTYFIAASLIKQFIPLVNLYFCAFFPSSYLWNLLCSVNSDLDSWNNSMHLAFLYFRHRLNNCNCSAWGGKIYEQNLEVLNVKESFTYIYHCALKG